MYQGAVQGKCRVNIFYLDYGETQYRSGNIADPHAGNHSHKHIGDKHCSRSSTCFAKNKGGHKFGYVVFRERSGDGETS